jgi:DNA-binding transcriptional MerR regulator
MITPMQAAETLGVSTSTLRRWAGEFAPFLAPRKGTKRLYSVADMAVFGRVKELYKQGLTTARVQEALPVMQEQPSTGSHALITISDFAQSLEYVQSFNAKLKAQVDEQAELIKAMQEQIDLLSRPFWKRILSPKSAPNS